LDEQVSPSQQHPAPAQLSEVHDIVAWKLSQRPVSLYSIAIGMWTHGLACNRSFGACLREGDGESGKEAEDDNGGAHIELRRIAKASGNRVSK
jgi:hypothetical protein